MIKKFFLLLITLCPFMASAQTQDSYDYQSEFTWGINKNTYGGLIGGFMFKKGTKISDRVVRTFGLEIMNVKHPQELRRTSTQGSLFIYGKSNYLYALRFQYGRDFILFKKAPQQGAEIKAVFALGPTLGFVAPYYVSYVEEGTTVPPSFIQYNTEISPGEIQGTGQLVKGFTKSKIKPGANFKAALNFEMGTIKSQVTGFEVGFLLDAYTSKVVMMPNAQNYALYPTFFIALFYGNRK